MSSTTTSDRPGPEKPGAKIGGYVGGMLPINGAASVPNDANEP